ncbi:MAG: outer membrane beta-barrel family protein, partial [Prevotella sp.]|nr:outer membrane beta-barrel family protein [Prevotella sp.]
SLNVGKGFKNDKLSVSIFAQSPFIKSRDFKNTIETAAFRQRSIYTYSARSVGISVSFRFGEMKAQIQKTKRGINNDDVMSGGDNGQGGQGGTTTQGGQN